MNKTTLLVYLLSLCLSFEVRSQIKNFNTESEFWFKGVLYLNNGKTYKGDINYIFVNDLARIKNSESQIKTLVANNVQGFVLFD